MFLGEKMEVNHLRIFGFLVFVHVPKENRTKLDPSRKNGILFGYSDTSKEYMIYILGHRKLRLSEMSPSMRVHLSANQNKTAQKRRMRRRMKLLEF
jgi:hypothetical protein